LMITWTVILKFLHAAQFAGTGIPGTTDAFRAAILSVDEEAVKDNIRHLRGVYDRFPDWLKDLNPIVTDNKMELEFKYGGAIKGFSLKQQGPRTYGFSAMLFDEMAFQAFARTTWTGAKPTLGKYGKMIAVSTPNGKGNFFYRLFANPDGDLIGVTRVRIPWWANPEHDQEWFDRATAGMEQQDIAREYELSFAMAAGRPVFRKDFNDQANVLRNEFDPPEYIPGRIVLLGWDMGYHYPACSFWQPNGQDQMVGFHSETGSDEEIYDFGMRMRETRGTYFPQEARYVHCVPHDAWKRYTSQSRAGHISDFDTLFNPQNGVFRGEQAIRGAIENAARLGAVRANLKLRADGRAGLVMSQKGCPNLIEGFAGGYAYPPEEKIIQSPEKGEEPEKNEYSHEMDSCQMVMTGLKTVRLIDTPSFHKKRGRKKMISERTGRRIGT